MLMHEKLYVTPSLDSVTVKILKIRTPKKLAVILLKFEQSGSDWLYHTVMRPKDADRMANSVDPDRQLL